MDGFAFSELSSRQDELATQKEELEKLRKQLTRKKGPVVASQREQLEREEVLKMRAAVLKKVCKRWWLDQCCCIVHIVVAGRCFAQC